MDVSPPQGPIHTWKDFLLHLLTITIGLLIALTLEAAVESLHHRHMVRDGRIALDREVAANQKLYIENVQRLQKNREQLHGDIEQLRGLRDGRNMEKIHLSWTWDWISYSGTAWTTARDSGAVAYMSPEMISSYSSIYLQQDYINSTAVKIFDEETKAGAALEIASDPRNLTKTQIEALLLETAELDLSLGMLQSTTMRGLSAMYAQQLNSPPRGAP